MKVNPNQKIQSKNIKFTSVQGELPKELSHFQNRFRVFTENFMKDKPGYDIVITTIKNNTKLKIKGSGGFTIFEKAKNVKPISSIKTEQDLEAMVKDNYDTTQAGRESLEALWKMIPNPFSFH